MKVQIVNWSGKNISGIFERWNGEICQEAESRYWEIGNRKERIWKAEYQYRGSISDLKRNRDFHEK